MGCGMLGCSRQESQDGVVSASLVSASLVSVELGSRLCCLMEHCHPSEGELIIRA